MSRKRRALDVSPSPFVKRDSWPEEGLDTGTEFQVRGEPGWFRFTAHVTGSDGQEWVDAYGGHSKGQKQWLAHRSFAVSRLKRNARGKVVARKCRRGASEED